MPLPKDILHQIAAANNAAVERLKKVGAISSDRSSTALLDLVVDQASQATADLYNDGHLDKLPDPLRTKTLSKIVHKAARLPDL